MITAEYAVLDGAKALALPTKLGQHMKVTSQRNSDLTWKSYDHEGNIWFEAKISFFDFSVVKTTNDKQANYLCKLLKGAVKLNSDFLSKWSGFKVVTTLDFPLEWGLGSSSTLTYLVAQWADVNPLLLHFKISDGSGYDVACAGAELPIVYQIEDDTINYQEIDFLPKFKDQLFFINLNVKQSSEAGIEYYMKNAKGRKGLAQNVSGLTDEILACTELSAFENIISNHEEMVAESLGLETVQTKYFSDYWGKTKSLGAWGGDFILATSQKSADETKKYFQDKGYSTVLSFDELFDYS